MDLTCRFVYLPSLYGVSGRTHTQIAVSIYIERTCTGKHGICSIADNKEVCGLAVAEFYHSGEDRPDKKVIINEAIELAKTYGGEGSYRFINGLLDKALQGE